MSHQAEILELFDEAQARAKYLFPLGELSVRAPRGLDTGAPIGLNLPPVPPAAPPSPRAQCQSSVRVALAIAKAEAYQRAMEQFAEQHLMKGRNGN